MQHIRFEYNERTHDGHLPTDEYNQILEAIRVQGVELADQQLQQHTRQFRDNFIRFMKENYTSDINLGLKR